MFNSKNSARMRNVGENPNFSFPFILRGVPRRPCVIHALFLLDCSLSRVHRPFPRSDMVTPKAEMHVILSVQRIGNSDRCATLRLQPQFCYKVGESGKGGFLEYIYPPSPSCFQVKVSQSEEKV